MDLITPALRLELREFCVQNLVLRQIDDIFQMAGLSPGQVPPDQDLSGQRRIRVAEYYAAIDWDCQEDVDKFLKAIGIMLSQSYLNKEARTWVGTLCEKEGLTVDGNAVRLRQAPTGPEIRNIIFAADGPKPEIVLEDSITNTIRIVANEQHCLVYDKPIPQSGLLWRDLVLWWSEKSGMLGLASSEPETELLDRLRRSLDSEPERMLFDSYFLCLWHQLEDRLPALLPQVYLHYDPYTIRQLHGQKRLMRQRMDFLMLLPEGRRVVIEIDGKQHYASTNGQASPALYAEMMAEDRRLRLAGYEVYRFGGYEFQNAASVPEMVESFFGALIRQGSG